jgi:hypothetical protein
MTGSKPEKSGHLPISVPGTFNQHPARIAEDFVEALARNRLPSQAQSLNKMSEHIDHSHK